MGIARFTKLLWGAVLVLAAACGRTTRLESAAPCPSPDIQVRDWWPVDEVDFTMRVPPGYREQPVPDSIDRAWSSGPVILSMVRGELEPSPVAAKTSQSACKKLIASLGAQVTAYSTRDSLGQRVHHVRAFFPGGEVSALNSDMLMAGRGLHEAHRDTLLAVVRTLRPKSRP